MGRGQIGYWGISTVDTVAERKRVVFRPATAADTVRVGDLVCYNSDVVADWKELATNRLSTDFGGENATAYAEGSQTYNGRSLIVEKAASGNLHQWAGVVAVLGPKKGADGDIFEIWVPKEGAVVPVYTDANCTLDETVLGVSSGSYLAQVVTGDGDPLATGVAVETVDRSGTNGLVWMRMTGKLGVSTRGGYLAPIRPIASGYAYGFNVNGDDLLRGTAASKSYVVQFSGDRAAGYVATGDSNDAILKISGNNYAACDANYILRGLNAQINQRSGGTCGRMDHNLGVQNKSGGTITTLIGLTITAENYGTLTGTDTFGGLDIILKNEAAVAATEFGIRVRNENNSIAGPVNAVLDVSETGANTGFTFLLDVDAAATIGIIAASGDITFNSSDSLIPVNIGGTTKYLVATDNV